MKKMKNNLYRTYFKKTAASPVLYCCIFAIAAFSFIRYLSGVEKGSNCAYMLDLLLDIDTYRKIIPIFAAIPFAANYSIECTSKSSIYYISRCGEERYIRTNLWMNLLVSFFTTMFGLLLFVFLLSFVMPIYQSDGNAEAEPYGSLLLNGFAMVYILIKIVIYSASVSMWVLSGVALSAFFPNVYVALCAPFIFSYIVEKITLKFPDALNLWYLSLGIDVLNSNAWITFFTQLVYF